MKKAMTSERRVLILGGGVIGVTSAYALAKRGFEVTVVERQDGVGLETSFANGSLITPSMADPWAAPGLPLKLLKWIGREESPFLVRLGALPGMMSWGLKFLANCNPRDWRRNTEVILRIAQYSQDRLKALTDETGISYDRMSAGTLRLFRDDASMADARLAHIIESCLRKAVRIERVERAWALFEVQAGEVGGCDSGAVDRDRLLGDRPVGGTPANR